MSAQQRPEPARDSKSNLYEAAVAAVKSQEEVAAERARWRPSPQRKRWRVFLLLLMLGCATLLVVQPVWLTGPKVVPAETPAVSAASLRLALLRERQRVRQFEQTRGHLPASLLEAGSSRNELGFEAIYPDAFKLWGQAGDSLITLRSGDSMRTFLGESLRILRDRGAP